MYSTQVLDHFRIRATPAPSPTRRLRPVENPACGDVLKLTLRVAAGRIEEIRFLAQGCVPALACASLLTELVQGKTIAEARQLRREELIRAIGGLPQASTHASHLAMDTLAALLKQLEQRTMNRQLVRDDKPASHAWQR
jgi:nitrogen fixation NifU-like protein